MNMKSMLGMYAFAAMAMSAGFSSNNRERYNEPKETEDEKKKRLAEAKIKSNKSKGLKEFFYGEISVWAINQKNADKKAKAYFTRLQNETN